MIGFFKTIFYEPLYNILVLLLDVLPNGNIAWAVIILTIFVKVILMPLSTTALRTQLKMKQIQAELKEIQEKFKENRQKMGEEMLALYRKHKINPFSSIFLILIQLPIIISLYYIFAQSGLPTINTEILYSFVPVPSLVDLHFLGIFDLAEARNLIFALVVGVGQFFQAKLLMENASMSSSSPKNDNGKPNFQEDFLKGMQFQMKFIFPVIAAVFSYFLPAVVGLYWIISSLSAILQEIFISKKIRGKESN